MSHELTLFALSGVAAGFFSGLFGIGGGLIMVPMLVYAFTTIGTAYEHIVAMALGLVLNGSHLLYSARE